MRFLFFNAAGSVLFERNDAESASVTHEEMSLQALFPYDAGKDILRGMRIGYKDALGVFQVYEIRKVRTLEPDHFQEVGAEHIAISELTDEFAGKAEWTNITASAALSPLLTNTGWSIGTDTTSNTSSGDNSNGDVWNATRLIQNNWNVYILPRVEVNDTGITGKYLDIIPAGGTWRGFRISLDKNANEIGVIWDDSKLKTALYAFGQSKSGNPLTFKDVVWTATADHPAKPANQTYLEDPAATAAYGRNGRPRFGYYQNASITNATTLLEKTWETLKNVSVPDVTVNATITDLYRLGYVDVPLRLHDTALIEIRPTGVVLQKEIIQYTEDLLDPLQSRLTIGAYIPNIIYINRQNARRGGGGGGSGQTPLEYTTANNTVQLWTDTEGLHSLCVGTGAQLNPDGSLVVDPDTGKPVFIDTGDNMWSQIEQNKSNITLKVSKGDVSTQLAVECGNVSITGGNLVVDGYVEAADIFSGSGTLHDIYSEVLHTQDARINGDCDVGGDLGVSGTLSVALENTFTCGNVACGNLDCDGIAFNGGTVYSGVIVDASVSSNTLTLTKSNGTTVTFSKATTLSGGWSSGTFTVNATQNNVNVGTYYTQISQGSTSWGDGSPGNPVNTATVPVMAVDSTSGGNLYNTGRNIYVDATTRYNAGVAYGEAKFTLADIRLQGTSISRKYRGYLYEYGATDPLGYGSWFLDTLLTTETLYKQGTRYTSTYYTKSSS